MFKKIFDATLDLGFTLAGSIIVVLTLSGETQRIGIILTSIAVVFHYVVLIRRQFEEKDE
jgi:hypothetical protein